MHPPPDPETTTSTKRGRTAAPQTPAADAPAIGSPLDAVTQLIAERQKYEKWLRDLDAKRDATPSHVFERVHGDYSRRLAEVQAQLGAHATEMKKHAGALVSRLRDLEAAERRLSDERAEAELRSHVGEMSKVDFDSALKRAERELARVQEEQQQVADDLNQIRDIVEGRSATDEPDENAPRRSVDFNELEFLKSVVGTPAQPASGAAPSPTPAPAPTGTAAPPPRATPASSAPAAPAAGQPRGDGAGPGTSGIKPIGPPPRPQQKDSSYAANVTGNQPIVLRNSGVVEQPKTLKCSECGSMNYPSEWYCERCGAELAAI